MTRIILIRHGDDEGTSSVSSPSRSHRDDPHITMKSSKMARQLGKYLIEKYGYPTSIISSPMKRSRLTAASLAKSIDVDERCPITIDARYSRYFTRKERINPSLNESTQLHLDVHEGKDRFRERIEDISVHLRNLPSGTVWIVTHALILKKLSKIYKFEVPEHINFLWHIRLSPSKIKEKGSSPAI